MKKIAYNAWWIWSKCGRKTACWFEKLPRDCSRFRVKGSIGKRPRGCSDLRWLEKYGKNFYRGRRPLPNRIDTSARGRCARGVVEVDRSPARWRRSRRWVGVRKNGGGWTGQVKITQHHIRRWRVFVVMFFPFEKARAAASPENHTEVQTLFGVLCNYFGQIFFTISTFFSGTQRFGFQR